MVKSGAFVALGFVMAIAYIRAAHRTRNYNLVQWIIGEPVRE